MSLFTTGLLYPSGINWHPGCTKRASINMNCRAELTSTLEQGQALCFFLKFLRMLDDTKSCLIRCEYPQPYNVSILGTPLTQILICVFRVVGKKQMSTTRSGKKNEPEPQFVTTWISQRSE